MANTSTHDTERKTELTQYARRCVVDGVYVTARCFAVCEGRSNRRRYEVLLIGAGQYAVVDVDKLTQLDQRVTEAVEAFAAAAVVRAGGGLAPAMPNGSSRHRAIPR